MSLAASTLALWRDPPGTDPGGVEVRVDGPCGRLLSQYLPGHPIEECNWGFGSTIATSDLVGVACDPYYSDCEFFLVNGSGGLAPVAAPVGGPSLTPRARRNSGPKAPAICENGSLLGAHVSAADDLVVLGAHNSGSGLFLCDDGNGWVGVYRRVGDAVQLIQEWEGALHAAHAGRGVATDGQTVLWRENAVGGTDAQPDEDCWVTIGGVHTVRAYKRLGPDGPFEEIDPLPHVSYVFEIDGRHAVVHDFLVERIGDSWSTVARLRDANGGAFEEFDDAMSMTEHTVVFGVDEANNNLGAVYVFDLSPPPPPYLADLNGDGCVGGTDLAILLGSWGQSGGIADLDGDGDVDGLDLAYLLGDWSGAP